MCSKVLAALKKKNMTADGLGVVKMERYTIEHRVFILEQYFKNNNIQRTLFAVHDLNYSVLVSIELCNHGDAEL